MCIGKLGMFRGQQHVAHQCEFKTARNGKPVDRANDRPGKRGKSLGEIDLAAISAKGKAGLTGLLEINAGGKSAARSRQHRCPDGVILR